MLAGPQIVRHDRRGGRISQEAPGESAEERREARNPHGEDQAATTENPPRLAQRHDPFAALREVIERAHQQHGVDAGVGHVEPARIAEPDAGEGTLGLARGGLARLLDVQRRGVDQMHAVTTTREPARVGARAAAHVEDDPRRRREVAQEQLARALRL